MVRADGVDRHRDSVLTAAARGTLLVVYTERLDACREFYAGLGLDLVREQHGAGPIHYAVELADGLVLELYPGRPDRVTGRLRLGFTVPVSDRLDAGEHRLADPDGRVVVQAVEPGRPDGTG